MLGALHSQNRLVIFGNQCVHFFYGQTLSLRLEKIPGGLQVAHNNTKRHEYCVILTLCSCKERKQIRCISLKKYSVFYLLHLLLSVTIAIFGPSRQSSVRNIMNNRRGYPNVSIIATNISVLESYLFKERLVCVIIHISFHRDAILFSLERLV
jgi:hypothetical protein